MNVKPAMLAASLLLAVALLAPSVAHACSCVRMDREQAKKMFRSSDAAIIGKLVKREQAKNGNEVILTYRIRRSFKRTNRFRDGELLRLRTPADGAACGIESSIGSVRGVFIHRQDGKLRSNLCLLVSKRKMRRAARDAGAGSQSAQASGCSMA